MRVVICDDNPIERKNLLEITTHISKSDGLDTEFEVFESAKQMLFEVEDKLELIDVMFLDINMPGIDGMEAASKLIYRRDSIHHSFKESYVGSF